MVFLLNGDEARIMATGYEMSRHTTVVISAMPMVSSSREKLLFSVNTCTKLPNVKFPSASMNAYTNTSSSGSMTNMAQMTTYG